MNVYDFDGTIYDGDSTLDFYFFCLKKRKKILLALPAQSMGSLLYTLGLIDKTAFKEYFYRFLCELKDTGRLTNEFWKINAAKIKTWYLRCQKQDDIIISASPEFLLKPVCRQLGIKSLIASRVNPNTGRCEGPNCRGEEKVRRFAAAFSGAHIDAFYSDSLSDRPMAKLAQKSFLVKGNKIFPWDSCDAELLKKEPFAKIFP